MPPQKCIFLEKNALTNWPYDFSLKNWQLDNWRMYFSPKKDALTDPSSSISLKNWTMRDTFMNYD